MNQYAQIVHTSSADEVNKYLEKGWELVDTAKSSYGDGSSEMQHVLGLTHKTVSKELLAIVKAYEDNGLKEELFDKIVDDEGDTLKHYDRNGFFSTENNLTKFASEYEYYVNGKNVSFDKAKKTEDPIFDDSDIEF